MKASIVVHHRRIFFLLIFNGIIISPFHADGLRRCRRVYTPPAARYALPATPADERRAIYERHMSDDMSSIRGDTEQKRRHDGFYAYGHKYAAGTEQHYYISSWYYENIVEEIILRREEGEEGDSIRRR